MHSGVKFPPHEAVYALILAICCQHAMMVSRSLEMKTDSYSCIWAIPVYIDVVVFCPPLSQLRDTLELP